MRRLALITGVATGVAMIIGAALLGAQTVVDETLGTISGRVIMQSDVRQARDLKLVKPGDGTDKAILTELQNRILVLTQIGRAGQPEPTADEVKARQVEWQATLPAGADVPSLLARYGMKPSDLDTWMRDNVRIRKYLQQLFGRQTDPEAAINKWILGLRQRAGLK